MKFIVDLWLDGYNSEEEMNMACKEFIKEQLDFTASSVQIEEYDESRESKSAIPSADKMFEACRNELKIQGEHPIGALSVMSPKNFFKNGWTSCYHWMLEELNRGITE